MLGLAAAEIGQLGLTNVEVRRMDAEELAFPDASFDFVFCGFLLFMLPALEQALSEYHRVLRPRGTLLASSFSRQLDERWSGYRTLSRVYRDRLRCAPQADTRGLHTAAEIKEAFTRAGFGDVQVIPAREDLWFQDEEEWWSFEWSHGNRSGLERMEPADLAERKQKAFAWIQEIKGEQGIPMWIEMLLARATKTSLREAP